MDIGTVADLLILKGSQRVVAYPGPVRRGKAWRAFKADNPDALIVTTREYELAIVVANAVNNNRQARAVLEGATQKTLYWDRQGRKCRGTPDALIAGKCITDLKTGETADPRRFPWKVQKFAYHAQLAWYREGAYECGSLCPDCYIVAVEQTPPFVVTVFKLSEHLLDMGSRLCRLWFEQVLVCEASGEFPGYSQSIVDLDLPEFEDELIEIAGAGE